MWSHPQLPYYVTVILERRATKSDGKMTKKAAPGADGGSKWVVVDTPIDAGLIPTLAVMLWIGWMGFLLYATLVVIIWRSPLYMILWTGFCTLSVLLPPQFPEPYGREIVGAWLMRNAARYFGLKTTVEAPELLEKCSKKSALIFAKEPHDLLPYSVFAFSASLGRILPGHPVAALTTGAIFVLPVIKVRDDERRQSTEETIVFMLRISKSTVLLISFQTVRTR